MTAEQMALANKMMDTVDLMIDPIQGVPPMRTTARGILTTMENKMRPPFFPMTAREVIAARERGVVDQPTFEALIDDLDKERKMRMQEGESITKPIPWHVIVWEEGTIHLESTIITTDRDMALLQAGADLADSISEDVALAECQVSARPAV